MPMSSRGRLKSRRTGSIYARPNPIGRPIPLAGPAKPPRRPAKPERPAMSWTDERVETLKRMWNEGQSASQIAKELGGVTRNAVIGKVHRLGLSNRVGAAAGPVPVGTKPMKDPREGVEAEEPAEEEIEALDRPAERPAQVARKPVITAGQPLPPQPA